MCIWVCEWCGYFNVDIFICEYYPYFNVWMLWTFWCVTVVGIFTYKYGICCSAVLGMVLLNTYTSSQPPCTEGLGQSHWYSSHPFTCITTCPISDTGGCPVVFSLEPTKLSSVFSPAPSQTQAGALSYFPWSQPNYLLSSHLPHLWCMQEFCCIVFLGASLTFTCLPICQTAVGCFQCKH